MSRALLRYRRVDLRSVAPTDRLSALRTELLAWQPFVEPRFLIDWHEGIAQVFALDAQRLPSDVPSRLWPESLLQAPVEGLQLWQGLDGVEAQLWREGGLQQSRWWPHAPSLADWQAFARHGREPLPTEVPPAQPRPWMHPSREPLSLETLERRRRGGERWLWHGLLMLGLFFIGASGRELWAAYEQRGLARDTLRAQREQASPQLRAREQALALADETHALLKPLQLPNTLGLLEHLSQHLPKGVVLRELDLDGLRLRMAVELPTSVARGALVEALEAGEWLHKVSEQREGVGVANAWVRLDAELRDWRGPQRLSGDAGLRRGSDDEAKPLPSASAPASSVLSPKGRS